MESVQEKFLHVSHSPILLTTYRPKITDITAFKYLFPVLEEAGTCVNIAPAGDPRSWGSDSWRPLYYGEPLPSVN
jgi:hypothetical protein